MPAEERLRSGRFVLERAVHSGEAGRVETWMRKRVSSRFGLPDGRRDRTGSRFRGESLRLGGRRGGDGIVPWADGRVVRRVADGGREQVGLHGIGHGAPDDP